MKRGEEGRRGGGEGRSREKGDEREESECASARGCDGESGAI